MACSVARGPGQTIVSVVGEVDLSSSPALRRCLLNNGPPGTAIIVDLSEVTFLDSIGLSVLLAGRKRAQATGGDLSLRNPRPGVLKVLEITGLTKVFEIARV